MSYVSVALRQLVITRAQNRCEYCLFPQELSLFSIDPKTGQLTTFFHPRTQVWHEHFQMDGTAIAPLTPEGRVTVIILQLNTPERQLERQPLVDIEDYPS